MTNTAESMQEEQKTIMEFIALAESDREAALKLMWPDDEERAVMKLLDAVAFDGFIDALKAKL